MPYNEEDGGWPQHLLRAHISVVHCSVGTAKQERTQLLSPHQGAHGPAHRPKFTSVNGPHLRVVSEQKNISAQHPLVVKRYPPPLGPNSFFFFKLINF